MFDLAYPLTLASGSAIRKSLLLSTGLKFSVIVSEVDEEALKLRYAELLPDKLSLKLAEAKALSLVQENHLILGCDQICVCQGCILNKPICRNIAIDQLRFLSGKTHYQYTSSVLILNKELIWQDCSINKLTMRNLSDEEINSYIDIDKPYNASGSYHMEYNAKHLFTCIEGDLDAIQGLPLVPLLAALYDSKLLKLI